MSRIISTHILSSFFIANLNQVTAEILYMSHLQFLIIALERCNVIVSFLLQVEKTKMLSFMDKHGIGNYAVNDIRKCSVTCRIWIPFHDMYTYCTFTIIMNNAANYFPDYYVARLLCRNYNVRKSCEITVLH